MQIDAHSIPGTKSRCVARPLAGRSLPLIRRPATAYVVALPGNKGAVAAAEKMHGCSPLFRLPGALHRYAFHHVSNPSRRKLVEDLGANDRRRNSVDADSFACNLFGNRLGQTDCTCLGGRIGHRVGVTPLAGNRCYIDDPPVTAAPHMGKDRPAKTERAVKVHRRHPQPVSITLLQEWAALPAMPLSAAS